MTMEHCRNLLLLLLVLIAGVSASDNGLYYKCDETKLADDNQCIFTLTGEQPDDWLPVEEHNVDRTAGADFYRGVQSYAGLMLSVSPKPWANGDKLVGSSTKIEGDTWSGYALIFELIAPLRDMMMYHPDLLDADAWALWTRALTDCNAKTEDYVANREGGKHYSTSQVYEIMKNPNYKDIHHSILQYLEEGTIDLVCLSTNMEMTHCDATREVSGYVEDRCNCWFDAYKAIYGVCPVVDMEFGHCTNTVAPVECTGVSGEEEPEPEEPEPEQPEPEQPEPEQPEPEEPEEDETEDGEPEDEEEDEEEGTDNGGGRERGGGGRGRGGRGGRGRRRRNAHNRNW